MSSNRFNITKPYNNKLTKDGLLQIFAKAENFYLYGNPYDTFTTYQDYPTSSGSYFTAQNTNYRHQSIISMKDWTSFGMTFLFRLAKAKARIPNINEINDYNANSVFINFLSSKLFGEDTFSLKYMVAAIYLGEQAKSDDEKAKEFIHRAIGKARVFEIVSENSLFATQQDMKKQLGEDDAENNVVSNKAKSVP